MLEEGLLWEEVRIPSPPIGQDNNILELEACCQVSNVAATGLSEASDSKLLR